MCMSTILLRCLNAVWLLVAVSLVSGQTLKDPALRVTEVVGGLNAPTTMAFIGPSDILVLQKNDGSCSTSSMGCSNLYRCWMCPSIVHPSAAS